jgi:regulator of vacuolar morphogenesis
VGSRSEAKGVPHILVGPNQTEQSEEAKGYEDEDREGGYYQDGAFIAAPDPRSTVAASKDAPPDAQEAYYLSLASRFQQLRTYLQQTPPLSAIESLTSDHPISLPSESRKAKQQWRFLLQNREPRMAQIACMDIESILEVVKLLRNLLAETIRSRSQEKLKRLGLWIWGVLGKCYDAGQLGSEEISELREMGKRAVGLLVGIRDRSGNNYGYDEDEEGVVSEEETKEEDAVHSREDLIAGNGATTLFKADTAALQQPLPALSELEHAKAFLQNQLRAEDQPEPNGTSSEEGEVEGDSSKGVEMSMEKQTGVMLDMIITIVGEFYGQRDLLEFRDIWEGEQPCSSH